MKRRAVFLHPSSLILHPSSKGDIMSFWLREIFGWLLVLLGLCLFFACFAWILEKRVIEAGALTVIGIVIFRGGIHLLKVAVAARICREARSRTWAERKSTETAAQPRPPRVTVPASR